MANAARLTELQRNLLASVRSYESVLSNEATLGDPVTVPGEPDAFVWVQATVDSRIDRDLVEGLVLLALLAYFDWHLWKQYVGELWPKRSVKWEEDHDVRPGNVGVDLSCSQHDWHDAVYTKIASASPDSSSSSNHKQVQDFFLGELQKRGEAVREIPVRVAYRSGARTKHTTKLIQVMKRQGELRSRDTGSQADSQGYKKQYVRLRVCYVDVKDYLLPIKDISRLQCVADAAASGAVISHFEPPTEKFGRQHPVKFIEAIQQLFPDADSVGSDSWGVAQVSLGRNVDTEAFEAVFSAIAASHCVRSVSFSPLFKLTKTVPTSADQQRRVWSWWAYSLFVRASMSCGNRMEHISIDTNMIDSVAVDSVKRILEATNPVAALFGQEKCSVPPETVSASRFMLLDPTTQYARGSSSLWRSLQPLKSLPVIWWSEDWVSVLLPRWGQAWMHRDDIVEQQVAEEFAFKIHSIPNVTLYNIQADATEHVVALLRLIGNGIRCLRIEPKGNDAVWKADPSDVDALCRDIFETCPVLEELDFRCRIETRAKIQTFLDTRKGYSGLLRSSTNVQKS